jgi:branched-chain amino acid transport system ATP-binding protein
MNDVLLRVERLTAGYGEAPVLQDIDIEVRRGELVALVGSNGAGKTSLLRCLSRLMPVQGRITFDGVDVTDASADAVYRAGLVQLPEGRQLFDRMSVEDNLLMGANNRSDKAGIRTDLERVYTLFPRMAERRRQLAGSMSGGEQQMCAMGRALMARPKLLLVDEMSLGLAPVVVEQLMDILLQVRADGVTVLLVEQDIHLALEHADRGYVVENGRIVLADAADRLLGNPEVQRAYLGI